MKARFLCRSAKNDFTSRWINLKSVLLFRRAQGNEYKSMALIEAQTSVVHMSKGINIINSLRPRLNRRPFADDIFKCIFLNENVWISIKISLKFVPKGPINNIPALVQRMAWRRPGDKPLSEPMMINLSTHICVSRPQWVNRNMESELWINIFGMHNKITVDIFITRT